MANEKAAAVKSSAPKKQKKSVVKYFKDARSEFKKVVWPTRKSVINNTIVVIVAMVVCGIAIWGMDNIFMLLIKLLLGNL